MCDNPRPEGTITPATATRRYRIEGVVGKGAFGTVFRAKLQGAEGFSRTVALKVLHAEDGQGDIGARLRDEARMLGLIRHRSVVQVDSLVALDDRWTIVREYVDGCDLTRLPGGAMPPGPALELISEVASALHVAHTTEHDGRPLGLLHRDLKPSNILLTRHGEVKVVDFGGARADFAGRKARTALGTLGSPRYMSPERKLGQDGAAGDVYALGVILYEIVTGQPFGETSAKPSAHAERVEGALRDARLLPALDALIRALVAYDPAQRPTARELESRARDLRQEVGGPYLRDWAEDHVVAPPLLETGHDFSTTTLFERSSAGTASSTFNTNDEVFVNALDTYLPVDDAPPDAGAVAHTRLHKLPPRVPQAAASSGWGRAIAVFAVLFVLLPMAFGLGLTLVLVLWAVARAL